MRPDWHAQVSSWVYSFAAKDVAAAHQNFMAGRSGFPKFAKKKGGRKRFTVIGREVKLQAGAVVLPLIGPVKVASPDPQQAKLRRLLRRGRARITSTTVSQQADGSWWVALQIERTLISSAPKRAHPQDPGPVVGVDRGVKVAAVAATADGHVVGALPGARHLRVALPRLARAQRAMERKTPLSAGGSRNRAKAVRRIGKLHVKAAAQREASLHAFSAVLTRAHATVVLETLSTARLVHNRYLAGAILDQGWAQLGRQVHYKSGWRGGRVLDAPGRFPSSKTCSGCGAVKAKLPLSQRMYECEHCGLVLDRDTNAAATLAAWGEHERGTCPCTREPEEGSLARDPHPAGRLDASPRHACGGRVSASTVPVVAVLPYEAGPSQPPVT